ncbi:MAG: antibiotic biosynthesis monooxygenase [Bacteroidia bacterium]|nr:MAG: antibiotic biosynthesis monooxygenase [Bacteroidia bacterium]
MWKKDIPKKDYYAAIFISTKEDDLTGYHELNDELMKMAIEQEGFLGYENVYKDNQSIFISYWESLEAIEKWKNNSHHIFAKQQAHKWYKRYLSQICKVEHTSLFEKK